MDGENGESNTYEEYMYVIDIYKVVLPDSACHLRSYKTAHVRYIHDVDVLFADQIS